MLRRRGFSLIEIVIVIVVLAVAVPPSLLMVDDVTRARADSVSTVRATALATGVLEQILADVYGGDPLLGFDALADSNSYLQTPTTGLAARISSMTGLYTTFGVGYSVQIGDLVDSSGAVSGDPANDVFRRVTVTATYQSLHGGTIDLPIGVMVTDL